MRRLKIDPRPPAFDSVSEATQDEDASAIVDDAFELAEWRAISPEPPSATPPLAFVDGVQQYDVRFSAEGEGWPIPGVLATYAAGAVCPAADPQIRHVRVERAAILARSARPEPIAIYATSGCYSYRAEPAAGEDSGALDAKLMHLRAELEANIVRTLIDEDVALVVVDGRLPPDTRGGAIGLIKTPHRMPLSADAQINVLYALKSGERSPVFIRTRSDRRYYSWFVCLRTPGPLDLALSGLAMMEMDDSASRDEVLRTADLSAAVLPGFAPRQHRDPRAPQNLLPVGQLERALRHRMGQREFINRLIREAFAGEEFGWTF